MPDPRFSPKAVAFLRALKRNNDREWFRERKHIFEAELRAPMIAVIERLSRDFTTFAPELVASPAVSLFRIYRDTRFSADKSPLKTHVGAYFPRRAAAPKHAGAGLYLEISGEHVLMAGGLYAPERPHLVAVREHIAANHRRFRAIVESPSFRRALGGVRGDRLQRVPPGFPKDHPAAEYLTLRQFLTGRERPASLASSARFYRTVVDAFRQIAPMIRFLNEPLAEREHVTFEA